MVICYISNKKLVCTTNPHFINMTGTLIHYIYSRFNFSYQIRNIRLKPNFKMMQKFLKNSVITVATGVNYKSVNIGTKNMYIHTVLRQGIAKNKIKKA